MTRANFQGRSKMRKQQKEYRDVQLKTNLQATDSDTTPEPPYTERKIIPFPGVKLSDSNNFQKGLDNFLQEMGYIE